MRYPPLTEADLLPEQRDVAAAIRSSRLGSLETGYLALLYAPKIADLALALGQFLRFGLRLPERLSVLALLTTAGRYSGLHIRPFLDLEEVRTTSLARTTIEALANGLMPTDLDGDETMIYEFARALNATGRVKDEAFARVSDRFGKEVCLELVALCGFTAYQTWILNVTQDL